MMSYIKVLLHNVVWIYTRHTKVPSYWQKGDILRTYTVQCHSCFHLTFTSFGITRRVKWI